MGTRSTRAAAAALPLLVCALGLVAPPPAGAARDVHRLACPPTEATPFTDVEGTRHAEAIACAVALDLTSGTTPTTYEPSAPVTRGQLATFLLRFLGGGQRDVIEVGLDDADVDEGEGGGEGGGEDDWSEDPLYPDAFDDDGGSVHEDAINLLAAVGLVDGTGPRTYEPDAVVSRAQMASFVWRALEMMGGEDRSERGSSSFDDIAGSPHVGAIEALAAADVVDGVAPRQYGPTLPVDRGAMAAFLVRATDHGIESGAILPLNPVIAYAALEGDDGATGTAALLIGPSPEVLCAGGSVRRLPATLEVVAPDGEVVAAVELSELDGSAGCTPAPGVAAVADDVEAYDVRIRAGGDALQGPLGEADRELVAMLDAVQVVPGPGDRSASGFAVGFTTTQPGVVCIGVVAFDDEFGGVPVEAAHLHRGAPHTNGPEVMEIDLLADEQATAGAGFCQRIEGAEDLADDPTAFYVDLHTADFPDGALRGQLGEGGELFPVAAGLWR